MKMILINAISAFLVSIFAYGVAFAGLPEATVAFKRIYQAPSAAQFEETPFKGVFSVRTGGSSINLFDEPMTINGYGPNWEVRENSKSTEFRKLAPAEAQAIWRLLRNNLKTDWMVLSPYSKGEQSTIVISAPNCPSCKVLEQDLKKYGQSLGANVHIVPMLLGKGSDEFANAILCSNNPNSLWAESWSMGGRYPSSNTECQKSRWAELVAYHTFERKGTQIQVRTPTIIRTDGSLHYGWNNGSSLAEVKERLGLK